MVRAAYADFAPHAGKGHTVYNRLSFWAREVAWVPLDAFLEGSDERESWIVLRTRIATLDFPLTLVAEGEAYRTLEG